MIDATLSQSVGEAHRPHIRWSAVFAGWAVGFGIAWMFYLVGLAVGFSSFDLTDTDVVAKGVGTGTLAWLILTWAVALFVGGMFASWVDGRADQTVGSLHGVAVWGLAMTLTVLLSALGFTQLLQGGASLIKGVATAGAAGGAAGAAQRGSADSPMTRATDLLGAQVRRAVSDASNAPGAAASPAAGNASSAPPTSANAQAPQGSAQAMSAAAASAIAADLLRGRNDDARARLTAEAGLQPAEADKALQGLAAQADKAKAQLREAAEAARKYTAAVMWGLLLSSLIALVAAAFGGWMGAGHIHRVHDGRRF